MSTASVGFHCPECVSASRQKVYTSATLWSGRPWATQILIGANLLVFVLGALVDGVFQNSRISGDGIIRELALSGPLIDVRNEWWRIFTSGFVHLGLLHIALNMYALWVLGADAERRLGTRRFVLVYFAAMVAGSFGALLVTPQAFTAGASGAIYGLFGLAIATHRSRGLSIWSSGLGTVLVINFVFTLGFPGISIGGHLGGLVGGYLAGVIVEELPHRVRRLPRWFPEAGLAVTTVGFFIAALWAAGTWLDPVFG